MNLILILICKNIKANMYICPLLIYTQTHAFVINWSEEQQKTLCQKMSFSFFLSQLDITFSLAELDAALCPITVDMWK